MNECNECTGLTDDILDILGGYPVQRSRVDLSEILRVERFGGSRWAIVVLIVFMIFLLHCVNGSSVAAFVAAALE